MAENDYERWREQEIEEWIEVVAWRDKEIWDWVHIVGGAGNLPSSTGETFF